MTPPIYPDSGSARDQWIVSLRPARNALNPLQPYACFNEPECAADGVVRSVSTLFLTNQECPWRCVMCDLWKNTLAGPVKAGAIPAQIEFGLARLAPAHTIKLYNSGSFFDRHAIPPEDYPAIARLLEPFERVIVESHPSLVGEQTLRFRDLIRGRLEVAMGLETVDEAVLRRLNKRMTLGDYARAAETLRMKSIDVRAFILVKPPFTPAPEALHWTQRSLDFAFDCGAGAAALIAVRAGNGAMDALRQAGEFSPPSLATLETAMDYGISLGRGRVFADLWDLAQSISCLDCREARLDRLLRMNLGQTVLQRIDCAMCGNCDV